MSILVLNGPNLNLLGTREPHVYGGTTLGQIESELVELAAKAGVGLQCFQSNHEGALLDRIHATRTDGTQFAIIEVHVSNVHKREAFRHHSYLSDIAVGVIVGLGVHGYRLALDYALNQGLPRRPTQSA
jgi:3-dehydroquinate dehydratase-2